MWAVSERTKESFSVSNMGQKISTLPLELITGQNHWQGMIRKTRQRARIDENEVFAVYGAIFLYAEESTNRPACHVPPVNFQY